MMWFAAGWLAGVVSVAGGLVAAGVKAMGGPRAFRRKLRAMR